MRTKSDGGRGVGEKRPKNIGRHMCMAPNNAMFTIINMILYSKNGIKDTK